MSAMHARLLSMAYTTVHKQQKQRADHKNNKPLFNCIFAVNKFFLKNVTSQHSMLSLLGRTELCKYP